MADGSAGKTATMERLAQRTFETRNATHFAHWKTKSFAEHMALGELYDAIPEQMDKIVEAYQGAKGLIKSDVETAGLILHLTSEAKWIGDNREALSGGVPAVLNMIDDLQGLYLSAIYKLKHLD